MKKSILLVAAGLILCTAHAQVINPKDAAKSGATDHVNNNISNGVNNSLDKTENAIKGLFKKKNKSDKKDSTAQQTKSSNTDENATGSSASSTSQAAPSLKTYQNYDFVPGEKVLFEDDFSTDQDGEFPAHWVLESGQAVTNKTDKGLAFFLTEGNYVRVSPRMKTPDNYLPQNFTIEFDFIFKDGGSYSPGLLFQNGSE